MWKIGLISDTHDLLRESVIDVFCDVDHIVHAGDITREAVINRLKSIAPVTAVKGNHDRSQWAIELPAYDVVDFGGHLFYVIHNIAELDLDLWEARFSGVIFGHDHLASHELRRGMHFINPGIAGPAMFEAQTPTCALMTIHESSIKVEFYNLITSQLLL